MPAFPSLGATAPKQTLPSEQSGSGVCSAPAPAPQGLGCSPGSPLAPRVPPRLGVTVGASTRPSAEWLCVMAGFGSGVRPPLWGGGTWWDMVGRDRTWWDAGIRGRRKERAGDKRCDPREGQRWAHAWHLTCVLSMSPPPRPCPAGTPRAHTAPRGGDGLCAFADGFCKRGVCASWPLSELAPALGKPVNGLP